MLLLLLSTSCGKDNKDQPGDDVEFSCTPLSLSFSNFGGEELIVVRSAVKPELTANASWLKIGANVITGLSQYTYTFPVTASINESEEERSAKITVKAGSNSATVTVSQSATIVVQGIRQEPLNINARQIAEQITNGINIGNTLEAINNGVPSETAWGNPKVNRNYIAGLKAAGFNAVRIPCAWDGHIINQETYTIDPKWLDRVYEVVGYCTENDMFAIVNIHWDGGWLEENVNVESKNKVLPKQKALWSQIAKRLGGYNERLLFAGTNEPYQSKRDKFGAAEMGVLLEYEQAFIDAVRDAGGNNHLRTLIFQGPATDIDLTQKLMNKLPSDKVTDRLMAEIHYYDPWNFCGLEKDESWGNMAYFWGAPNLMEGSDRNSTWGDEGYMKKQFDKMKTQFVDKGIPVVIGEYGAIVRHANLNGQEAENNKKSRAYYDGCVSKFAKERGMVPFLWDTGEIFDRKTGDVKEPEIVNAITGK